jgi:hypothetical protein
MHRPHRIVALLASLALPLAANAFSLEMRAAPLARLLPILSERYGVTMEADATTSEEVLVLRLQDVSRKDLMGRISEVLEAQWVERDGRFILSRSPALTQAQERREAEERLEQIAKRLERFAQQTSEAGAFNEGAAERLALRIAELGKAGTPDARSFQQIQTLRRATPEHRLLARLLPKLGPRDIAAIPKGKRIVFSTSPNRMQRRLPQEAMLEVVQYVREQTLYAKALAGRVPGNPTAGVYYGGFDTVRDATGSPAKVVLAIQHRGQDQLSASLLVASDEGRLMCRYDSQLVDPFEDLNRLAAGVQPGEGEKPPVLSAESQAFVEWLKPMAGGTGEAGFRKPTGQILEMLLHPERYEPLDLVVPDYLIAYARGRNSNLVAHLNARSFFLGAFFGTQSAMPSGLIALLAGPGNLQVEERDGWTLMRHAKPSHERRTSMDRALLGRLLREIVGAEHLTIDLFARNEPLLPDLEEPDLASFLLMMSGGPELGRFLGAQARHALKVYTMLAPSQRQMLRDGRAVPYQAMSAAQIAILSDIVFNDVRNVTVRARGPGDSGFDWITSEVTESLPNGLAAGGALEGSISEESLVVGVGEDFKRPYSAMEMAWEEFTRERPEIVGGAPPPRRPDRFLLGRRKVITFELHMGDHLSKSLEMQEVEVDERSAPVTYAQLPEAFRSEVDKRIKQYREAYRNRL